MQSGEKKAHNVQHVVLSLSLPENIVPDVIRMEVKISVTQLHSTGLLFVIAYNLISLFFSIFINSHKNYILKISLLILHFMNAKLL